MSKYAAWSMTAGSTNSLSKVLASFSSVGLRGLVVLMLTYSSMNVSLLTATQVPTTRTPAEITWNHSFRKVLTIYWISLHFTSDTYNEEEIRKTEKPSRTISSTVRHHFTCKILIVESKKSSIHVTTKNLKMLILLNIISEEYAFVLDVSRNSSRQSYKARL